jgi:hypothetical protein
MNVPDFIDQYLWDVEGVEQEKHSEFIIARVLEYGDGQAFDWLRESYSAEEIKQVLETCRNISAKTANFYCKLYNVPLDQVECLKKPYTRKQDRF